jgi:hypothetical protein
MQAALSNFSREVDYQLNPVQKGIILTMKGKMPQFYRTFRPYFTA